MTTLASPENDPNDLSDIELQIRIEMLNEQHREAMTLRERSKFARRIDELKTVAKRRRTARCRVQKQQLTDDREFLNSCLELDSSN
ncbi:hypothetical protein ACQ4M3_39555 [Leptolyngbya sp. AN03gr2]|uniref:hypothetical protein n=1 Tax=unclassified Leptolyngbya TaxID=2650499 RepID=UPI003D316864